jgi:hypothetical protein
MMDRCKIYFLCFACLILHAGSFAQGYPISVQVNVMQPVPPYLPQIKADVAGQHYGQLNQDVSSHLSITLTSTGNSQQQQHIKLAGSIERVAPTPMSVSLRPDFQPAQAIIVNPHQMISLNRDMLQGAFGNFSENSLIYNNLNLETLRQNGVDFKLPEGTYRVCVTAYDYDRPGFSAPLSTPGTGCAYFTICYTASAPQLIQPVSTMLQSNSSFTEFSPHSSQIPFTWTPPSTTCGLPLGALTYNLEIRSVFPGQTVTDAQENPYVFHQQFIPTTTFLLDTLKYPHVLMVGQQYIVRVKANFTAMPGSPLEIANEGYSQLGAFTYQGGFNPFVKKIVNEVATTPSAGIVIPPGGFKTESYSPGGNCGVSSISNKAPGSFNLNGQQIRVGAFIMHTDQATRNGDGSYTGYGYITWSPFHHPIELKVNFNSIKINTDTVVYDGSILTSTNSAFSQWPPLSTADQVASYAGASNPDYQSLEDRINNTAHLVNQLAGNDEVDFPLGLNNTAGMPGTLAIMGMRFTADGAAMNVLFNLNIPEANGWLSLAGTGICIHPTDLSLEQGVLYLPQDHTLDFSAGMKFSFKACPSSGVAVDTSQGTYVKWDAKNGLDKIMASADLQWSGSIVPLDAQGLRQDGQPVLIHARFGFSDWNDWVASATPGSDFEMNALPGFNIHSDGIFYDHSNKQNPAGISFPSGYTGAQDGQFEGLYIPTLTMSLPPDFKKFGTKNGRASFGFSNFILDNKGVTTNITANHLLDLGSGSIGGWAFSIEQISIAIVEDNPLNGMKMTGGIQLPLSPDPLNYTCNLNSGEGSGIQYQFAVTPAGSYNVKMWAATLSLDGNSALTIDNKSGQFTIAANLNGHISVNAQAVLSSLPDVNITALSFQGMGLTNNDHGSGQFHFDAGNWSLGGAPLRSLAGINENSFFAGDRMLARGPNVNWKALQAGKGFSGDDNGQDNADGFGINLNGFKPYFRLVTSGSTPEADMGITFTMNVNLDISGLGIDGGATMDLYGKTQFPSGSTPKINLTPNINLDSVYLKGDFGPLSIDGGLKFFNGDNTYGNGVKGFLDAQFIGISVSAAGRFGKVSGYNYWGVAARMYSSAGIVFPPGLSINGIGGGFHYNMRVDPKVTDGSTLSTETASTPAGVIDQLTPVSGSLGFSAQVIMAFLQPSVVCLQPTFGMDFSSNAGLEDVWFDGDAEVLSSNPPQPGTGIVNAHAHAIYTTDPGNFNCTLDVNAQFLGMAGINIPIQFNTGDGGDYLYVGYPASSDQDMNNGGDMSSMVEVQMGFDVGIAHANAKAYAYFDIGDKLPASPYIPPAITNVKDHNGNSIAQNAVSNFSSMLASLESPLGMGSVNKLNGTVSNPGFLFGAGIHLDAGLDLVVVSADGSLDIGFAALLEHFNPEAVKASGCSTDGKIGFNNWYALGIFYADFNMSLNVGWFTVGSLNAGAILSAGLISPTWATGDVFVDASAFDVIHFHDYTSVSIGDPCHITRDPLDGIDMIGDFGPREQNNAPVDVYEVPYVIGNVPLNTPYPVQVAGADTRTYKFIISAFDISGGNGKPLAGIQQTNKGEYEVDLQHTDMLCGNATYTVHIQCRAQQLQQDGSYGDPTGPDGKPESVTQDTSFTFTTGPRPTSIEDLNVMYSYPLNGQRYLLKNEFGSTGHIVVGKDIGYLLNTGQVDDCGNTTPPGAATPANHVSGKIQSSPGSKIQAGSNLTIGNTTAGAGSNGIKNTNTGRISQQIRTNTVQSNLKSGPVSTKLTQYLAEFIPADGGDTLKSPFTYDQSSLDLQFPFPAGMKNGALYSLQIWVIPPPAPAQQSSAQTNAQTRTLNQKQTVYSRDESGNLVTREINEQINVGVTTHSLSGGRQMASKDSARRIYTSVFGTSKYDKFSDKMAAYGQWKSMDETPQFNISIYNDASGTEPFDQYEIRGYQSKCVTYGSYSPLSPPPSPLQYAPLFSADVIWNPAMQNDHDAGNIYAAFAMLDQWVNIDLGAPEVRGSFGIPIHTMSLENMPYQPLVNTVSSSPTLFSAKTNSATLPRQYLAQKSSGNTASSNQMMGETAYQLPMTSYKTSGSTGSGSTASTPAPGGLLWKRDAYLMNDFELIQAFAYDAAADQSYWTSEAVTDVVSYCPSCNIETVQLLYGALKITAGKFLQATSAANAGNFWNQINQIKNMRFPYFPPTAGRPLNFGYSFSFCSTCGVQPATAASSFNYKKVAIYIPVMKTKKIR